MELGTYNGTLGSMTCSTVNTGRLPMGSTVDNVVVKVGASHTFAGDLQSSEDFPPQAPPAQGKTKESQEI